MVRGLYVVLCVSARVVAWDGAASTRQLAAAQLENVFGREDEGERDSASSRAARMTARDFAIMMALAHPDALGKHSTDADLRRRATAVKQLSGEGGMEENEYVHFFSYIRDNAPQRLLVWGLGYDSVTLSQLNEGGSTLFLEMDVSWVGKADNATQHLNYAVFDDSAFNTTAGTYEAFIASPHRADQIGELAGSPCFDTVLVDSPLGYSSSNTGRAVPIYTASHDMGACLSSNKYSAAKNVTVFVHDCHRKAEGKLTVAFLGEPTSEVGLKKLREFRLQEGK